MSEDLEIFRQSVREIIAGEFAPHFARWIAQGCVDREAWRRAGELGLLCVAIPEAYGGGGGTIAHDCVIAEELEYAGIGIAFSIVLHSAIVAPYLLRYGTPQQQRRWLPALASGETIAAIAMTEPGAGSDLQSIRTRAARDGERYVINGQKTFITNGQLADLIVTACTTEPGRGAAGISLFGVEAAATPGFRRGRNLQKIGLRASDTSELFYEDAGVAAANLLGEVEGQGFRMLMEQLPQERLIIAVGAVAAMERATALTVEYTREREMFGKTLSEFQNTQLVLAEAATETRIARTFVDDCIGRLLAGRLDAATASMAKWWCTERQFALVDRCLQLFGGYGYMAEYPISRMFVDARVQRIYGGTNEIMKLLIARSL